MRNETKREILFSLSLMCLGTAAIIFIYEVLFHWQPFWLQLKHYWVHLALTGFLGFLFLGIRKGIPKKSNLPLKVTPGKLYAGRELNRQRRKMFRG